MTKITCDKCGNVIDTDKLSETLLKLKRVEMGVDIPY